MLTHDLYSKTCSTNFQIIFAAKDWPSYCHSSHGKDEYIIHVLNNSLYNTQNE